MGKVRYDVCQAEGCSRPTTKYKILGLCNACHQAIRWKTNPRTRFLALDWQRRKKYGIGNEEVARILQVQGGVCALCGGQRGDSEWHVDHDHETGKIRAILCARCNTGLGHVEYLQRRPGFRERALEYLQQHRN